MEFYYLGILMILFVLAIYNFLEAIKWIVEKNEKEFNKRRIVSIVSFVIFMIIYILSFKLK
ncbi:uncharacterized membrane protein YozB (DUF420 family) [Brevibacillus aydinogluensis]|nr:uncharacterized membrane protein YozB (DUF420 family) [Brevibacillus aydinogluensis]REK62721.1 MAG: hypothetical protein DF221_12370 [Brevibacillus sp.]